MVVGGGRLSLIVKRTSTCFASIPLIYMPMLGLSYDSFRTYLTVGEGGTMSLSSWILYLL